MSSIRPAARRAVAASGAAICLLISELVLSGATAAGVAVAGYAVLAALALGHRQRPGFVAAAGGLAANAAVIALNGAMPVRSLSPWSVSHVHRGLRRGDRLTGLADVIRLPGTHTMVSAGDAVLVMGAVAALAATLIDRSPWLAQRFGSMAGDVGGPQDRRHRATLRQFSNFVAKSRIRASGGTKLKIRRKDWSRMRRSNSPGLAAEYQQPHKAH